MGCGATVFRSHLHHPRYRLCDITGNDLTHNARPILLAYLPLAVDNTFHNIRLHQVAAVSNRGYGGSQLDRCNADALTKGNICQISFEPLVRCPQQTNSLARQIDSRLLTETKIPEITVESLPLEHFTNFRRADIRAVLDDLGRRQFLVLLMVVDISATDTILAIFTIDLLTCADNGLVESGRHEKHFKGRAWLIAVTDSTIPPLGRLVAEERVGVILRVTGHRQDFACCRLHHHNSSSLGTGLTQAVGQLPFGDILQVLINRQVEIVASRGALNLWQT